MFNFCSVFWKNVQNKTYSIVLVTRLGALLNKQLDGKSRDDGVWRCMTTPHKHVTYTVGTALSSSPPQPLLFEIKLSMRALGQGVPLIL